MVANPGLATVKAFTARGLSAESNMQRVQHRIERIEQGLCTSLCGAIRLDVQQIASANVANAAHPTRSVTGTNRDADHAGVIRKDAGIDREWLSRFAPMIRDAVEPAVGARGDRDITASCRVARPRVMLILLDESRIDSGCLVLDGADDGGKHRTRNAAAGIAPVCPGYNQLPSTSSFGVVAPANQEVPCR
jgi:hypothetical protein